MPRQVRFGTPLCRLARSSGFHSEQALKPTPQAARFSTLRRLQVRVPKPRKLLGGNDELSDGVAAHAVDRARGASTDGILVATGVFGGDGDGTIRAANDRTFVVKGVVFTEVNHETGVLGTG